MFSASLNTLQSWMEIALDCGLAFSSHGKLETEGKSEVYSHVFGCFARFCFSKSLLAGLRQATSLRNYQESIVGGARRAPETQFLIINKQQELALPSGPQIVQHATRESRQGTRMETVGSDYSFKISPGHVGRRYAIDSLYNCNASVLRKASPYSLINMDTPSGTWALQALSTTVTRHESCVASGGPHVRG